MKKIIFAFLFGVAMMLPATAKDESSMRNAPTGSYSPANAANSAEKEKVKQMSREEEETLIARLDEIKAMDKSELTRDKKRELRKEVTAIREKFHKEGGVSIFVSTTGIIIILLLILLL